MSIAQAFAAGLEAGGRGSGLALGLKQVLSDLETSRKIQSYNWSTGLEQQGSLARTMLGEGYTPTVTPPAQKGGMPGVAWDMQTPSLPESMQPYYSTYKGKPYRTAAFPGETIPGQQEAMSAAYMEYLDNEIPKLVKMYRSKGQNQLADLIETKATAMRDKLGAGMLGITGEEFQTAAMAPQEDLNVWGKLKRGAGEMMSGIGENIGSFFQ